MADTIWQIVRGDGSLAATAGPLVATAIHDGHQVRDELCEHLALDEASRLREEDPYTGTWTALAPTRVVGLRSRFEVDLNRPRQRAVYRTPADAWGLQVWTGELPEAVVQRSLTEYDRFYAALGELYQELTDRHGSFVVYDLHSYNHRRDGPDAPAADPAANPEVNVGTGTMTDRRRWAPVIDRFLADLASFDLAGGRLDVRENLRFQGGECARWTHQRFAGSACVLSVEVKKLFMDEWTGVADQALTAAIGTALAATVPGVLEALALT